MITQTRMMNTTPSTASTFKLNKINVLPMSPSSLTNLFESSSLSMGYSKSMISSSSSSSSSMNAIHGSSSLTSLKRFRVLSAAKDRGKEVVERYVWTYRRFYQRNGDVKEEVWRRKAVTSGKSDQMNDNNEEASISKPILSYEKFYYPDGVTLYSEKWTYSGYAPFPFGFPPFASDEKKDKTITEKLKDESFSGIVQGVALSSFQFVVDNIINLFRK